MAPSLNLNTHIGNSGLGSAPAGGGVWYEANAIWDIDYAGDRAYLDGVGETVVSDIHNTGSPYALTAAARAALAAINNGFVLYFEASGGTANPIGLIGWSTERMVFQFQGQLAPPKISINIGGSADQFVDMSNYTAIGDPFRAVLTSGSSGGTKAALGFNNAAAAGIISRAETPAAITTEGFNWNSGWADRPFPGTKVRQLLIKPEDIGGVANTPLSDVLIRDLIQNGI